MRVLIFHGYLLRGTGSNVYNARLAEALLRAGHEVHLLCQDRDPQAYAFVDAAGDWDDGTLTVSAWREPVRCTVYRPNIGSLLPVYVADRYDQLEARTYQQCSDAEIAGYVAANVAAVAEVSSLRTPHVALANHLVMGPLIVARALAGRDVPYAAKIHGSALHYTVRADPERFLDAAREGLAGARAVLVGSRFIAASLWEALADPELPARTRLGPPGVDTVRFAPRDPEQARAGLHGLARAVSAHAAAAPGGPRDDAERDGPADAFARDEGAAGAALAGLHTPNDRLVAYVGKLIVSKGVDLLVAAWPLVLASTPDARLVVVGFGSFREPLEQLLGALAAGDLLGARALAVHARTLEADAAEDDDPAPPSDAPPPLHHLLAFLDGLTGARRDRYLLAALRLPERVVFTGRLEHEELAELLPACEAVVVPSTFPEAFGMVAVEAAACGSLPISAGHSGLAEVSAQLALDVPEPAVDLLSFSLDDDVVEAIADRVARWLEAPVQLRSATRAALVQTARRRYSWDGVARGVLAGACGRLEELTAISA
jgi:glycosyltransferase involved in cell wall biosynthesis